jgi:hypothetical protein
MIWRGRCAVGSYRPTSRHGVEVPTLADCAYAAGFLDGEGTFGVGLHPPEYSAFVSAGQVVPDPLDWLADRWGGGIGLFGDNRVTRRDCYAWIVTGRQVLPVLRDILPHLIVKRAHATLLLEFAETVRAPGGRQPLTPGVLERRAAIYQRLRHLNARGTGSLKAGQAAYTGDSAEEHTP